jgi:hypothetical protein
MRRELFAGNDAGWAAYAAHMRTHLSWFAGDEAPRIPDKTRKRGSGSNRNPTDLSVIWAT